MAIAPQLQPTPFQPSVAPSQPLRAGGSGFSRLWWHTKAYSTVLGVMVLSVGSLVVLYLVEQGQRWRVGKSAAEKLDSLDSTPCQSYTNSLH